jgi:hypothetical protein
MTTVEIALLIALAVVCLCGLVAIGVFMLRDSTFGGGKAKHAGNDVRASIQREYFKAVGEILRETARQRNGALNLNDILIKANRRR